MELEVYKKSDFYEDYISSQKEYYERENADAYFAEKLAEKDKEIAELKQKLENVQASMYADVVDANMENRRLKEERRWRSVSEELPEVEEDCGEIFLVAVETESNTNPKGGYVTSAEFCNGEWYNDVTGNEIEENIEREDCFYRSKVTHWMHLPEPPKEADE